MKTKFIKGTGKAYTISEEGVVVRLRDNKTIVPIGLRLPRIVFKNKEFSSHSTRKLLWINYKFFNCIHCGERKTERFNLKAKKGYTCVSCGKEKINKNSLSWISRNPEKHNQKANLAVQELTDGYVQSCFKLGSSIQLPKEIIDAKRKQLILYRASRKNNKE